MTSETIRKATQDVAKMSAKEIQMWHSRYVASPTPDRPIAVKIDGVLVARANDDLWFDCLIRMLSARCAGNTISCTYDDGTNALSKDIYSTK